MIILDNITLSAFTRLKLFSQLEELLTSAIITESVLNKYSVVWQKRVPNWIKIVELSKEIKVFSPPISLTLADLSLIRLSLEYKIPIASDDKSIRQFAKKLGIKQKWNKKSELLKLASGSGYILITMIKIS